MSKPGVTWDILLGLNVHVEVYQIYMRLLQGDGVHPVPGAPGNQRQMLSGYQRMGQGFDQLLFKVSGQARHASEIHRSKGRGSGKLKHGL